MQLDKDTASNETTFAEFLKEQKLETVRTEWVLWAFDEIRKANSRKVLVNPDWLRAQPWFQNDNPPEL